MNNISEITANQLIEAFELARVAMKGFDCQVKQTINASYKLALTIATNRAVTYLEKVLKSTWVTRWYWKRKFKKAMDALDSLIATCPPPEHFQCRCESKMLIR